MRGSSPCAIELEAALIVFAARVPGHNYFSLRLGDTVTPRLTGIYWSLDTVASAMEEAGFGDLRWVNSELSEQGRAQYGAAFWDDFLRKLPHLFLECTIA
ncbi:MAG TPA: hypothetical protein VHN14_36970 [Kofleriaceae bacterium]|nr:hypothetical protein [Kofleriaceae bacterium]